MAKILEYQNPYNKMDDDLHRILSKLSKDEHCTLLDYAGIVPHDDHNERVKQIKTALSGGAPK